MWKHILVRLILAVPVLFGVSVFLFTMMQLTPGGPEAAMVGETFDREVMAEIRRSLGLDDPLPVQYGRWLARVVQGDLGRSFQTGQPVGNLISQRFAATLQLTLAALGLALMVAVPVGIISAVKIGTPIDYGVSLGSFMLISFPGFWLGMMAILVFAGTLGWFPPSGIVEIGREHSLASRLHHAVLPTVTLAAAYTATYIRFVRSGMLDVLRQDYMRTASAKGLNNFTVLIRHGFRNALLAPITLIGLSFPHLVGGTVTIETVFAWPGMGQLAVTAVTARDYPLILGIGLVVAIIGVMGNLLADILYTWADPRIRYD